MFICPATTTSLDKLSSVVQLVLGCVKGWVCFGFFSRKANNKFVTVRGGLYCLGSRS